MASTHRQATAMLPFIGSACAQTRRDAKLPRVRVAALVLRADGSLGVSDATLSRFENGRTWPQDPDAVVAAYAAALNDNPYEFWATAVDRWFDVLHPQSP